MAIYHLNCSYGSRQGGQSALTTLHYVLREGKYARGRDDLVARGWGNLPDWCDGDPARLFAAADMYERANGRLYVEAEGALPVELDLEQQEELVRAFMTEFAPGLPIVYVIHAGRPTVGKPRNRHFHGMASERVNDGIRRDPEKWFARANRRNPSAGGAPKDRSLKGHEWVDETRHLYERLVNEALERAGRPERVTAESHRDRIERARAIGDHETAEYLLLHPPGIHMGPTACAIERGGPGRPGQPTERGQLARARAAEAARLRAHLESVERELKDHEHAAVTAARDAGVDEALVVAAQSGDSDEVFALDDATEERRQEIRDAALAAGFSRDAIEVLRQEAEPESPELGWRVVLEATAERQRRDVAEAAARNAELDAEAVYRKAGERGEEPVDFLKRETARRAAEIMAAAQAVLLDDKAIARIIRKAESREPESGLGAVVEATEERRQRKDAAELAARSVRLSVFEVYATMRKRDGDPLDFLERETTKREAEIREVARGFLDDEEIERVYDEAESKAGSGWGAVVAAAAESSTRNLRIDGDAVDASARERGEDQVEFVERATSKREAEIRAAARAVFLNDEEIERIRATSESKAPGSGWATLAAATTVRRSKKAATESEAGECGLDIATIYAEAAERSEDPIGALEREIRVERQHLDQQAARYETLVGQPGGRDLYTAWLTELDPDWRTGGEPPGELVDRVLDAAASDSRLERLTRVIEDAEAASFYHGEVDTDDQVTLRQIDEGLHAAEESMRRRSVAEEQGRDPESAPPAPEANEKLLKLAWKIERAADAAETELPTTQLNQDRPDYRVPAASNEILDHVADTATDQLYKEIVEEVRERYDDDERRESEDQYLQHATEIEHARATRSWKASRDRPRPTRDSAEASVRKKHRSAVRSLQRSLQRSLRRSGRSRRARDADPS